MCALKTVLVSAFLAIATALPTALEERAATTCGSNSYTADQVNAAAQKACAYYQAGTEAGSSTYPHTYNNFEGFSFKVAGPYQEFPLLASHAVYTGGEPGADRVIINTSCKLAGEVTHTGASGNNFVGCTGTS
ncbi:Guanyl-specific ribonuclease F1 [Lachnellula suecica]|uniref:ribonuclease T1 n=1 Tax=Lachnellula suecica TaxID=602035 RepID=A0A8T9BUQ5_9HELO|nr:Guanyl-specific ribonuclease F1 [Lachnellula suecica]